MAGRLANTFDFPVIYLDRLFWRPNWEKTPDDQFHEEVKSFIRQNDNWVIDGNFRRIVGDLTFSSATCILWLDPPFALYFPRLVIRTFLRLIGVAPPCSPGCGETLSNVFSWGKKSIIWWCWNEHIPQRKFCTTEMQQPGEDKGGKWIRLGGWRGEVNAWLKQVEMFAKRR
ncbi:hypothetical protein K439DRAFT_1416646 [Ramaria rubella]|nr:hypothetical protein K439DRAFT_1416646 [Ramaria rubella]